MENEYEGKVGFDWLRWFEEKQILEIVLAIAVKTLSNYSNHILHTEIDPVFSGRKWTRSETVAG